MAKLVKYAFIAFLLMVIVYVLLQMMPSRVGIDVSAQEANGRVHHKFRIPESATRVRYVSRVRATRVNVWMTEEAFLDWAREQGWVLEKQSAEEIHGIALIDLNGQADLYLSESAGWIFRLQNGHGFFGKYDIDLELAEVNYAH